MITLRHTLLTLTVLLCTVLDSQASDKTITIMSGGVERTFRLHLPADPPATNLPLLLVYHGSGGTSANIEATTNFDALADQYNFIAVYPQSLSIGGDLQWNVYVDGIAGDAALNDPNAPDDVAFTHDIINYLGATYGINAKRVYASGLSNGAFMCYALLVLGNNDIAAIAPVAGNLWGENAYLESHLVGVSITPIPVMHVHGTADKTVDYPDPDNTPKPYEEFPLFYVGNGCGATTYTQVVPIMNNVDKLVFCPPPVEVSLIRITGMDHAWSNGEYPTSREIVKFFKLDGSAAVVTGGPARSLLTLPSALMSHSIEGTLTDRATIEVIDVNGRRVYSEIVAEGPFRISADALANGVYVVRAKSASNPQGVSQQKILVQR